MKAIRKAYAVDFWVWKEEWSKRQAAVELDKFSREIDSKAFVKRYSVGNQGIPSKYAIRLKDTEVYLYYGKEENTYKFDLLQSSENNLVWFITEQEAQNFINKGFFNPAYNAFEAVQIEGDE